MVDPQGRDENGRDENGRGDSEGPALGQGVPPEEVSVEGSPARDDPGPVGPQLTLPGPRADAFIRGLARRVLAIFFRRVEVVGAERTPAEAPLVVVANHVNGLVDPALLAGLLPRMPRFLGKSTLWEYRSLRWLLKLAGVIPVYRRSDPGVDRSKNVETFARCWELLARGGVLALFPEGKSHSEPGLQRLKTGAARILLEAERRYGHPDDPEELGVRVLPVGLVYDAKHKFRSRVLVQVGEPLDPSPELERYLRAAGAGDEDARWAAVEDLTGRIDEALSGVILDYESWEEARLVVRAADLYTRRDPQLPSLGRLEEGFSRRRAFLEGYRELSGSHPERTEAVAGSVEEYDDLLRAFHLKDRQVAARYPPVPVAAFLARTLFTLLVLMPVAAVGTVLNALPYWVLQRIAARFQHLPDQQATFKVFPGLVAYPLTWLLEAVAAGWMVSGWVGAGWALLAAVGVFLAGPATGWIALRFHDKRRRFFHEVRAFLVLAVRRGLTSELKERRRQVAEEIGELVELYRAEHGD